MKTKLFIAFMGVATIFLASVMASFPVQRTSNLSETSETTISVNENNKGNSSIAAAPSKSTSGKSQVVALVLGLLVGGLGVHRFYLGYTWQGVVQLLTAGGCGIWALIDIIRIATGDLKPKGGRYSKTL